MIVLSLLVGCFSLSQPDKKLLPITLPAKKTLKTYQPAKQLWLKMPDNCNYSFLYIYAELNKS